MDQHNPQGKELLRVTPSEAANIVLDDILSDPGKEMKARTAIKKSEQEIDEARTPGEFRGNVDFLVGNIVCSAVYGTTETGINDMASSFMENVYSPLGFMPKSEYDPDLDVYDDNTEQNLTSVDPSNMLIELGALVMRVFEGDYAPQTAKSVAQEAKMRASTPSESFPAYTPGESRSTPPSTPSSVSAPVDVSSKETVIRPTPQKISQGNM